MTRPTHLVRAALALAATVTGVGISSPAAGAWNGGVAATTFYGVEMECTEGQALPCPPDVTYGPANTIYIGQTLVDGELQFGSVDTTSQVPDMVWVQTRIGAQCRTGYRLDQVYVEVGDVGHDRDWRLGPNDPGEVLPATAYIVPHPDTQEMPDKDQALHFPIDAVVGVQEHNIGTAAGLLELGENVVADRVAAGEDEADVRAAGFELEMLVPFHASVTCEGVLRGVRWIHITQVNIPIHLVFLGDEIDPGSGGSAPPLPEAAPTQVTQATLSVLDHPSNPCVVVASGTFVTNAPATVDYRIVDTHGQHSQVFSVDVDHTLVAFVSHDVEIPPAPLGTTRDDFVTPPEGDGDTGGLVDHPSDMVSGVLTIEVLSPNAMTSNPDGFRMPPCDPSASTPIALDPVPGLSRG